MRSAQPLLKPPDPLDDDLRDLPLADGYAVYMEAFAAALVPPPPMLVSDWADRHRILSPKASSEPGRWRTARTPYIREVMDALAPSCSAQKVVFAKGSQIAGTEAGLNWLGWIIDQAPGPAMMVQPTDLMAKRVSKQRLDPMIQECPRLQAKVRPPRERDSGNTTLAKDFPGGILVLTGANSAIGLRSMPARYLFLDEIDAYPQDVGEEGDPVELALRRTTTFSRRKIFMVSTPTIEGRSRIAQEYEDSDQRHYFVPCPECDHRQWLQWHRLKWEEGRPETVRYCCEACGCLIPEHRKTWMLERGEWMAAHPERSTHTRGYHLSSLYSPIGWYSWRQAAEDWGSAQESQEKLRVFVNHVLAETWKRKGDAPKWETLWHRREPYPIGTVPAGAAMLTAGVDVQGDRIEYEVVGWGRKLESWSVEYGVIPGDPATAEPWQQLDLVLVKGFPHALGGQLKVRRLAIDAGFATQYVYAWVRRHGLSRVIAVQGRESMQVAVAQPTAVDVTVAGKTVCSASGFLDTGVMVLTQHV